MSRKIKQEVKSHPGMYSQWENNNNNNNNKKKKKKKKKKKTELP